MVQCLLSVIVLSFYIFHIFISSVHRCFVVIVVVFFVCFFQLSRKLLVFMIQSLLYNNYCVSPRNDNKIQFTNFAISSPSAPPPPSSLTKWLLLLNLLNLNINWNLIRYDIIFNVCLQKKKHRKNRTNLDL